MAKVRFNASVNGFRGRIGNLVYREVYGKTVVSPAPDFSDRVLTEKQVAVNNKLCSSSVYAKTVMADPQLKAAYVAWARELNLPLNAAIYKDWYHPPSIEAIDLAHYTGQVGQSIGIRAVDIFRVVRVAVTIREVSGQVIETGMAEPSRSASEPWIYQTTSSASATRGLVVEAVAFDSPGHQGSRMELLPPMEE